MTSAQQAIWRMGEDLIDSPPTNNEEFYSKVKELHKTFGMILDLHVKSHKMVKKK